MKRLIGSEFKKIFKSKINILLLLCLFAFSGYRIYDTYSTETASVSALGEDYVFQTTNGEDIVGLDYYKTADQVLHEYAGVLSNAKIETMKSDYENIVDAYQGNHIDNEYMTYIYGDDYASFLEDAKNGKYTYDEINEKLSSTKITGFSAEDIPNSKNVRVYLPYYHKEDRVLALYNMIYTGFYTGTDTRDDPVTYEGSHYFDQLTRNLLDKTDSNRKTYIDEVYKDKIMDPNNTLNEDILEYYNHTYRNTTNNYDSVIGNTLFVNALVSIEFASLLVLVLVLANTFAMERQYKTDQILVPSVSGWRRITMAKVATSCILAISILVIQIIASLIVSFGVIPMRDLSLAYMGQAGILMNYNVMEYVFTYKEIIISGIALMGLASIATALITTLCSYLTKSRFLTAIPLLLVVLISGTMNFFEIILPGSILDAFFPSYMFHFTQYFQMNTSILNVWNIFDHMIPLKDIVMLFWGVSIFVIIAGMYIHSRHYHTVKSC